MQRTHDGLDAATFLLTAFTNQQTFSSHELLCRRHLFLSRAAAVVPLAKSERVINVAKQSGAFSPSGYCMLSLLISS